MNMMKWTRTQEGMRTGQGHKQGNENGHKHGHENGHGHIPYDIKIVDFGYRIAPI